MVRNGEMCREVFWEIEKNRMLSSMFRHVFASILGFAVLFINPSCYALILFTFVVSFCFSLDVSIMHHGEQLIHLCRSLQRFNMSDNCTILQRTWKLRCIHIFFFRAIEESLKDNQNISVFSPFAQRDPENPYERRRCGLSPVGLKNIGNSCWFNVIVQVCSQM